VHQSASCDLTSEFDEVWVAYNTIRDDEAEIASWSASALLRHKGQAPRSIVVRCRCPRGRRQQNRCSRANQGKVFHTGMSVTTESALSLPNGLVTACDEGSV
jgi:hypothetical protein